MRRCSTGCAAESNGYTKGNRGIAHKVEERELQ